MKIKPENGAGISPEGLNVWVAKNKSKWISRSTWPQKSHWRYFSDIRVHYKSEEEYVNFVWDNHLMGHKICQIIHLTDCVRIVMKLYSARIFFLVTKETQWM
jgi:hypothetical protein